MSTTPPDDAPSTPTATPTPPAEQDAFAEALVTLVREQLQSEREDAAFEAVRSQAAQLRRNMAALQAVPLRNADEPHFIFRPVREEG